MENTGNNLKNFKHNEDIFQLSTRKGYSQIDNQAQVNEQQS